MCGISGIYDYSNQLTKDLLIENINSMCKLFRHRGPDNYGYWIKNNIIFGHNRLSIQDVSNNGNQPMLDKENGNLIIFNGEIYNYKSLRKDLEKQGERFFSHSDTEVILKLYRKIGLEKSLKIIVSD